MAVSPYKLFLPYICELATRDIFGHMTTLYDLVGTVEPGEVVVELGVRNGDSTRALFCGAKDYDTSLYSFDINDCEPAVLNESAKIGLSLDHDWEFIQEDSIKAGLNWKGPPIGLLFIDTTHALEQTLAELRTWSLKVTGVICGHDYLNWTPGQDGVKPAVMEFLKENPGAYKLEIRDCCLGLFILWPARCPACQ